VRSPGEFALVEAALHAQEDERRQAFSIQNAALDELMLSLPAEELVELVDLLRLGDPARRELGARLLSSEVLEGQVIIREVSRLMEDEFDPDVIRWLVAALGNTRTHEALPLLAMLSFHDDSKVRFVVPDSLSKCSPNLECVLDTLVRLAKDQDRDVRWSSIFEICAWLDDGHEYGKEVMAALQALVVLREDDESEISDIASEISRRMSVQRQRSAEKSAENRTSPGRA
jgi:HEAT repeat protein